jgi:tRNA(Ile)-lysidine synthase
MSFRLTHPLPNKCLVAVSGGVDSMAVLHWLCSTPGRVKGVLHVNHRTGRFSDEAHTHVVRSCNHLGVPFYHHFLEGERDSRQSPEEFWREARYRWFDRVSDKQEGIPVILAHNMQDCLEEYILCTMIRGFSGTIPYRRGSCVRPFRLWKREDITDYATRNHVRWVEDPSNRDIRFKRNFVRRKMLPGIIDLNPGIYRIVERIIREQDKRNEITGA